MEATELGLYFYVARWYDSELAHFIQADQTIPGIANAKAYDRFAYVENNPILFADLNGLEKVIILYGEYDDDADNASFSAAAETQKQKALAAGYTEEDILMVKTSTEDKFFEAIEGSEVGEIEHIYVFSHGWSENYNASEDTYVPGGGLQLGPLDEYEMQIMANDLGFYYQQELQNRFAPEADIYLYACSTARGTLPQTMADVYDVTVYAYEETLSFFETVGIGNSETEFTIPYVGFLGNLFSDSEVEMSPSIGVWNFVVPNRSIESRKFFPNAAMQRAILRN